jgi:hypothetical protein
MIVLILLNQKNAMREKHHYKIYSLFRTFFDMHTILVKHIVYAFGIYITLYFLVVISEIKTNKFRSHC